MLDNFHIQHDIEAPAGDDLNAAFKILDIEVALLSVLAGDQNVPSSWINACDGCTELGHRFRQ